jgi:succinate dehydrogenase / fumarate reductase cytochrome b subunit
MADVNRGNRPLSPHATIYRWPLNAIMSIGHRITGVSLALAGVLLVWWFVAAATSPAAFARADGILTSWLGDLVLFLSMLALWYHAATGIRHLVWDTGAGFDVKQSQKTALVVLAGAAAMALITVIAI